MSAPTQKHVLRWLKEMECAVDPWVVDGVAVPWVMLCAEVAIARGDLVERLRYCTPTGEPKMSARIRPMMREDLRERWRRLLVLLPYDARALGLLDAGRRDVVEALLTDIDRRLAATEFVWQVQHAQRARQARLENRIEATRADRGLARKTHGEKSRRIGAIRHGGAGWTTHEKKR
jgi:hypothetical protein